MLPTNIGRYRILGVLGEGGMGTVYEAEQDQPKRTVALKVIRRDFVGPEVARRFSRESEVLGRLQHPGIAQIYEAGTVESPSGPQSFFAMELVRGPSLTEYARAAGLGQAQRLELFTRICEAVQYAHQQGVVHRDLKPANILVDASGQPKILDFGVARLTDADVQATRQTSVGEVVGTLQYMSPEQVNADPVQVDARSDVYSLGVILYELLSGRLPYDLTRKLIYEAAKVILLDDPAPLSSIDRRLRGDLEVIVAKSVAKEKERRYDSPDALASDIRRFLQDEPILARRASALYQLRKFGRRNRALVGGLGLAAAALMIGTVVSLMLAVRARAAERLAEDRRSEAVAAGELAEHRRTVADSALQVADSARAVAVRERAAATRSAAEAIAEAAKARAINEFLQSMLASSDPANARGKELTVRELLDQAASGRSRELEGQPDVQAGVETTIGRTYFALGLYDQAQLHLDSAYAIRRRTQGPGGLDVGQSADDLGKVAQAAGDYEQAERRLREALAVMRAQLPPDDDRITSSLQELASTRYYRSDFAHADSLYREALRLTRARHPEGGPEVAERLGALGGYLSYTGRAPEGLPLLADALAMQRRIHGSDHPAVVDALIAYSDTEVNIPDYAGAERSLREALPIAETIYGGRHPTIANVLSRLATAVAEQGNFDEAEPLQRRALAMRIELLGEDHSDVQLARVDLARLVQQMGRYAEADTLLRQALTARRAVFGDESPAVASTLLDLGLLSQLREDWAGAEARFREAAPIWHAASIEDQELFTRAALGWALQSQSRYDEADTILNAVLARERELYGEDHWTVGDAYEKLSAVALGLKRTAQAESLAVKGLEIRRKVYGPESPQTAGQLLNVAYMRELSGDTTGAIQALRESFGILTEKSPASTQAIVAQRFLALDLCAAGPVAEGDSLIRALVSRVPVDSTASLPWRVRAVLGFCMVREDSLAEAEPLLLEAEAGLAARHPVVTAQHDQVVQWLVDLYERWGKPEEAATWRARLSS